MNFETLKSRWPNTGHSRFVESAPHVWHVQRAGQGEGVLLLHGAGASTASWADLFGQLAALCDVMAVDLPGQGFSQLGDPARCGMDAMAEDLIRLMEAEGFAPSCIVGHSAGAALGLKLSLLLAGVRRVVALNAALENFPGAAGVIFPLAAKMLASTRLTARMFSFLASGPQSAARLLASTGSRLPDEKIEYYRLLLERPEHVDGALLMMSQWEIDPLLSRLSEIRCDVAFLSGAGDRTVRPNAARDASTRIPKGHFEMIPNLGHMMHEEAPQMLNPRIISLIGPAR